MEKVRIYCTNNKQYYDVEPGTKLIEIIPMIDLKWKDKEVLAAYVNHKLEGLSVGIYMASTIEFLTYEDADGRRCYNRSANFLLQKAVFDLFPEYTLCLDYHLPNGQYGEMRDKKNFSLVHPIEQTDIDNIKKRMKELVEKDLMFVKTKLTNSEAVGLFRQHGQQDKARLAESLGNFFLSVYFLDGYGDTFYGPLLYSSGYLQKWDLSLYNKGFCLQVPESQPPHNMPVPKFQEKLSEIYQENSDWCEIIGARDIATVNKVIQAGYGRLAISVAEALHSRKYARIADMIYRRKERVKLVLIAGPSSSGKTTTSKRIALETKVLGLNPIILQMDDYFVNRELTPKDKNGEYDFESVYALNLEMLNEHLQKLFAGEEVTLPRFNFTTGESTLTGPTIKLKPTDILIMEGIHALNPLLTEKIPQEMKFKVYASALTSISIDENNSISTTDNRQLRRMVRDHNFRGYSAEQTIMRWASVTAGERENIFPFQENADIMFNSSLLYELPLLKFYAEPLLRRISPMSPAYAESLRLLNFLSRMVELNLEEQKAIPPTSVLREFIGGSAFIY